MCSKIPFLSFCKENIDPASVLFLRVKGAAQGPKLTRQQDYVKSMIQKSGLETSGFGRLLKKTLAFFSTTIIPPPLSSRYQHLSRSLIKSAQFVFLSILRVGLSGVKHLLFRFNVIFFSFFFSDSVYARSPLLCDVGSLLALFSYLLDPNNFQDISLEQSFIMSGRGCYNCGGCRSNSLSGYYPFLVGYVSCVLLSIICLFFSSSDMPSRRSSSCGLP